VFVFRISFSPFGIRTDCSKSDTNNARKKTSLMEFRDLGFLLSNAAAAAAGIHQRNTLSQIKRGKQHIVRCDFRLFKGVVAQVVFDRERIS